MENLVSQNNYSIRIQFDLDAILPKLKGENIRLNEAKEQFKKEISIEIDYALFKDNMDSRLDTIFSIINEYKDTSYKQISLFWKVKRFKMNGMASMGKLAISINKISE